MAEEIPEEFVLHSKPLDGPIEELNLLERSLLFAELSKIAYLDGDVGHPYLEQLCIDEAVFIDRDGAQAWVFGDGIDRIVACRGTEPNEWNDLKADARATTALAETVGRVHRGFKEEVDDLWPRLDDFLVDNTRTVWFTGHSLGAAMATICAGRCFLSEIDSNPRAVYTYGSPRVGNKRYINYVELEHIRWVNNNDVVTRTPPAWMRYRHSGTEIYLDRHGDIRRLTKAQKAKDRSKGFWTALRRRQIDHFSDHSIGEYIRHIAKAAGVPPRG